MIGPGKYDGVCRQARAAAKASGCLLIVFNGEHGHGFSAQLPIEAAGAIPRILRDVADQIERENAQPPNAN